MTVLSKEEKANKLLEDKKVRLVYSNVGRSYFVFIVKEDTTVVCNRSGWICDNVESESSYRGRCDRAWDKYCLNVKDGSIVADISPYRPPVRWSCSFRPHIECYHVRSCKILLEMLGLFKDDFKTGVNNGKD